MLLRAATAALLAAVACTDASLQKDVHRTDAHDASADVATPKPSATVLACREAFDGGLLPPVDAAMPTNRDAGRMLDAGEPRTSPSFRNDLMPFFATHCNFGGCHIGREATGQMQLGDSCYFDLSLGVCTVDPSSLTPDVAATVRANLLAPSNAAPKLPRVTPGDVTRSFLMMKLSGCENAFPELTGCADCGDPMPIGMTLRDHDLASFELIARWIEDGATLD